MFDVLGATDATGYVKVLVENGVGATGFFANDAISFQFSPAGDRGTDGDGAGDVVGPSVSVQDNLAAYDGTGGKQIKDSGVKVADLAKVTNNLSDLDNKNTAHDNLMIKGADVASAATLNLETATGSFVNVIGTVATTANTLASGHQRLVRAAGAWPITVGASLTLNNGGAGYTCVAGDMILFVADGSVVRGTILQKVIGLTPFWGARVITDMTSAEAIDSVSGGTRLGATLSAVHTALSGYVQGGNGFSRLDAGNTGAPAGLVGTGHPLLTLYSSLGAFGTNLLFDRTRNRLQLQSVNNSVASGWAELWDSVSLPKGTKAQAEAGTGTDPLAWAPEQIKQAIIALAPAGGRATLSGTANAIVLASSTALVTGAMARFRATAVNTGAGTIAYGGGTAIACRTIAGVALPAGYIRTDVDTVAIYDGPYRVLDRQIERGSNANGEYTRFADGTQICSGEITSASTAVTRTLPASYVDSNYRVSLALSSTTTNTIISLKVRDKAASSFGCFCPYLTSGSNTVSNAIGAIFDFITEGYCTDANLILANRVI